MREFIAKVSAKKTEQINPELFDRTMEKSIAEYIVSGLKVIESLPYIKLVDWKLIEDASKIDIKLNRRHIKDKNIDKNKDIKKLISTRDTAQEMLELYFKIDYDGESRYIKKRLLIPSYIDKYHLLINGKEVLAQKQIVDMSTYNQKKSLKLKTTLTPIDLYKQNITPSDKEKPFITTENDDFTNTKTYIVNLFTKELNPLYYYFAKFGTHKTINFFSMRNIVDVVDEEYDNELYYYFQVNKEVFIEVDKNYFNFSEFVRTFTYMVYNMYSNSGRVKLKHVDDIPWWTTKLGNIFTTNTKTMYSKGQNVLVSFSRILDDITRDTLRLDKKHLQSSHSLFRWLIQNYPHLRKKNNHDLATKRMRCNELTAFYFIQGMSQRINQLLNKKKLTIEAIERIFNWNSDELFRVMLSNKSTLLKYDADINCFDMLNALRYSFLGSQGISGGKNIGDQFRDIYPSHLGRLDINSLSHGKNTALTGFIVPKCKIYGNGFFTEKPNDPDEFNKEMKELRKVFDTPVIMARKAELDVIKNKKLSYFDKSGCEFRDGRIVIHRKVNLLKNLDDNTIVIGARNCKKIGYKPSYRNVNGIRVDTNNRAIVMSRLKTKKKNGLFSLTRKNSTVKIEHTNNQE